MAFHPTIFAAVQMHPEPLKQAYSVRDFCAAYSLGRTTVYREIKDGRLQVMKVGRRTLITIEAVMDWQRRLKNNV